MHQALDFLALSSIWIKLVIYLIALILEYPLKEEGNVRQLDGKAEGFIIFFQFSLEARSAELQNHEPGILGNTSHVDGELKETSEPDS